MDKRFDTSDLRLGAFLRMSGMKIADLRSDAGKVYFCFDDSGEREGLIRKFYNRESTVEPLAYMASISEMRDMVTMVNKK